MIRRQEREVATLKAAARSCSNIAFIKYWGNRDDAQRLPANGSLSMNLAGLETITTVELDDGLPADRLILNGEEQSGGALQRVVEHLDRMREIAGVNTPALVTSRNNFPAGTGIASSASAFSALTVAAASALGLELDERTLSRLARRGSGSACRSIPPGFVEWYPGHNDSTSFATSIAPPDHWDLVDLVAVVSSQHKQVGSTGGHRVAATSPLQQARVDDTQRRLDICRAAILQRDFAALADVVEQDALLMHAVMMTSQPSLVYWLPPTLTLIETVVRLRGEGLPVCFTIDAGPNVHVITASDHQAEVAAELGRLEGVQTVLAAVPGPGAHLVIP
jgi:diphosphomevalonate decarboxylase